MRPSFLYPLFASPSSVRGVGDKYAALLENLGIGKIIDLLWHLPYAVNDRRRAASVHALKNGEINTVLIRVIEHIAPKSRKQPYQVLCEDEAGNELTLVFFKAYPDSIRKNLPEGCERLVSGKTELFNGRWQMSHPDYIVAPENGWQIPEIEPVYGLTAGITNKFICRLVQHALSLVPPLPEWLETNHQKSLNLPSFAEALRRAHHPRGGNDLLPSGPARMRLAYDELLANQLALALVREKVKKQVGRKIAGNGMLRRRILERLPFSLTAAQEKVLAEIYRDQAAESRMLRLLQGDVGSGKTIVALLTMLNAVECGTQAAIMAPTEILAKQHFDTIAPLLEEIGLKAALLTGRIKGKARTQLLEELKEGKINILIGTHALFVEDVTFADLACVIIDEQHRFGVHQRLNLSDKGSRADVLVMTATPIPRTLILTAFGDMEYSKIDQLPEGRKPVDTRVMPLTKIDEIIPAVKRKTENDERVYWVCPLVEESEKIDLAAAENRFEILQKTFGDKVGLVHGKMKEKEKDAVMERFKNGEIKLLVATTVIEVGVNVPEATVMIVEHAERFGLAQLHQLRGRVKRGVKPAVCILLYGYPLGETSRARLNVMRDTEDGFLIAEEDLKLRGGGEILGTRQSGAEQFRLAEMPEHQNLLITANKDARMIIAADPDLASPRGQALRTLLYLFERDDAVKTYLAG